MGTILLALNVTQGHKHSYQTSSNAINAKPMGTISARMFQRGPKLLLIPQSKQSLIQLLYSRYLCLCYKLTLIDIITSFMYVFKRLSRIDINVVNLITMHFLIKRSFRLTDKYHLIPRYVQVNKYGDCCISYICSH